MKYKETITKLWQFYPVLTFVAMHTFTGTRTDTCTSMGGAHASGDKVKMFHISVKHLPRMKYNLTDDGKNCSAIFSYFFF